MTKTARYPVSLTTTIYGGTTPGRNSTNVSKAYVNFSAPVDMGTLVSAVIEGFPVATTVPTWTFTHRACFASVGQAFNTNNNLSTSNATVNAVDLEVGLSVDVTPLLAGIVAGDTGAVWLKTNGGQYHMTRLLLTYKEA